ncbi:MAG TPA: 2-dehydropantoate 2-reductase [Castellaniella sp.]|uniref:ketopantoate reductase family protein n=1 Tax=Castellaniella sp. TaxID=1955812 RepID=UPI002EF2B6C8
MKIAIVGAGGVGGYFGALLARSGTDVTFIARGAHLAALQQHGLLIENTEGENIHVPNVKAVENPAAIGPVDLVFLAVKLADSEKTARTLHPLFGPQTCIASFQNSVGKDDILRREFGDPPVMGGVAYISAYIDRPGVIRHVGGLHKLVFGEFDGNRSPRALAFLQACQAAGFDAELTDDIRKKIWEKFVLLVGISGATTTMRKGIGPIRDNPLTRQFLLDLMQETAAVGRAQGVALPENYARDRLEFTHKFPADMTASMTQDLKLGKPLEVMWLSGAVTEMGAQLGVPTPANRAVRDILALYAEGDPKEAAAPKR